MRRNFHRIYIGQLIIITILFVLKVHQIQFQYLYNVGVINPYHCVFCVAERSVLVPASATRLQLLVANSDLRGQIKEESFNSRMSE